MKKNKKIDEKTATIIFIVVCVAFCAWVVISSVVISSVVESIKSDIEENGVQMPEIVEDAVDDFDAVGGFFEKIEDEANNIDMNEVMETEPQNQTTGD